MVKALQLQRFPLDYSTLDSFWMYREYPEEDLELIDEFLNNQPQNFKLFSEFIVNLEHLTERFGVRCNPQIDEQFSMKKSFEDEVNAQWAKREILEKEAVEKEKITNSKKITKKPVGKRPVKKKVEEEEQAPKLNSIQFKFTRVDKVTLKLVWWSTNDKTMIRTIKFWDCNLTYGEIEEMQKLLEIPKNVIDKIFIFYNEISNPQIYVDFFKPELKLQMLTLFKCGLHDQQVIEMLELLKEHNDLVMIDLFWNNLTGATIEKQTEVLTVYRRLEYIGLGKNKINSTNRIGKLLAKIGRYELNDEEYEQYLHDDKLKDNAIEKNKKLHALKKEEEPVPYIDPVSYEDGVSKKPMMFYCYNLKLINLNENNLETNIFNHIDTLKERIPRNHSQHISLAGNFPNSQDLEMKKIKYEKNVLF